MSETKEGVIFVAGAYGTGKSTLCSALSIALSIPCFSAGDLISKMNGEKYGANKVVENKEVNQDILASEVQKLLIEYNTILLAGHFCIFGKDNNVEILPDTVFEKIPIVLIVLLEADGVVIAKHLKNRDGKDYEIDSIKKLCVNEYEQSISIASKLSVPIIRHNMRYTNDDVERITKIITDGSEIA